MNSSTNLRKPGKFVNAPVMKKDAMAISYTHLTLPTIATV